MIKTTKDRKNKPLLKKWWFWLIVVSLFVSVFGKRSPEDAQSNDNLQDPSLLTELPNSVSTDNTDEKSKAENNTGNNNEFSVIDSFVEQFNSFSDNDIDNLSIMDIHGEDYRVEYRLNAFENAVGKRGESAGCSLEVINYGVWDNDKIRFYGFSESYDNASAFIHAAIHVLDPSISDEAISNDIDLSNSISASINLGDALYISGYINESYSDGGISGYEFMIDCSKLNFVE